MSDRTHVLDEIARELGGLRGPRFWRSLEELADTPRFREAVEREFPSGASELNDPVSRRQFLRVMGASFAFAGLAGCVDEPRQPIVPYVRAPELIVQGQPLYYATALPLAGSALGVLAESHMGRPTKIEGNPLHPASLGATDAIAQASVLELYDPDRSTVTLREGQITPWTTFVGFAQSLRRRFEAANGAGFRLLTSTISSPTLLAQIEELFERMPEARWHRYDLALRDTARQASLLAFAEVVDWYYRLDRADVILSLDADIFTGTPEAVRYSWDFAERRRVRAGTPSMNRLYAVGPTPTPTGAIADHRLPIRAADVETFARALAAELGVGGGAPLPLPDTLGQPEATRFLAAVAADLRASRGRSAVIAGEYQPVAVHALAQMINAALGNAGQTVIYIGPIEPDPVDELTSLRGLAEDMAAGRVEALLILGGNPVYAAPADLDFGRRLLNVPIRMHSSLFVDETSRLCTWHLPAAHFLESWSDARTFDGTVSIVQPLIEPLYDGHSGHEILAAFSAQPSRSGYDIVRDYWRARFAPGEGGPVEPRTGPLPGAAPRTQAPAVGDTQPVTNVQPVQDAAFEEFWRQALHAGVVPGTEAPPRNVTVRAAAVPGPALLPPEGGLELVFRPDPSIFDGRYANNPWLQELPKPMTAITWGNAVLLAPATAARLGLSNEQVVSLRYRGRSVDGPVFILPGHAVDSVTVHLGFGREAAGEVGTGVGFNANAIRTSDAPWAGFGLELVPTGAHWELATTQLHHLMHGRDFVRAGSFALFLREPDYPHERHHSVGEDLSLYPEWLYTGVQWGMAIDNTVCTGCSACVIACQAENNVPVVGREGVIRQREMHWLRIDHYYQGDLSNPRSFFQPMLCQHCEKAPCEIVCPVAATTHSTDGLNQMIYNRCVGTRYCSNNCPYKVRRFNFFDYAYERTEDKPTLRMLMNPDVTVRTRGVMEKCTYCIQRISSVRIEAGREGREIRDGEVATACESACPTRAIVFGNINDPSSRVTQLKKQPHNYLLLEELNTQPRTSYLAAIRNLSPLLEDDLAEAGAHGEELDADGKGH